MMLIAGHETTSGSLFYALMMLAIHPEYQRKLQQEIDSVVGDIPLEEITYEKHYRVLSAGCAGAIFVIPSPSLPF